MSGSDVRLPTDGGGMLGRLVTGAATLLETDLPPWALVGGLAVMFHLAEAHRVTRDVDAVVDEHGLSAPAVEVLVTGYGATFRPNGVRLSDGTEVDVIAVGHWMTEDLPAGESERLFVLAHWWVVQTATRLHVAVVDGRRTVAEATLPVATPAALVATKLQAARNRRRLPGKAATDVLDVYRLLRAHDRQGAVAEALASAPEDVGSLVADVMVETLVDNAARWARRLEGVVPEDLDVVGSLCAERLRSLL